jgi:hypothetical protein
VAATVDVEEKAGEGGRQGRTPNAAAWQRSRRRCSARPSVGAVRLLPSSRSAGGSGRGSSSSAAATSALRSPYNGNSWVGGG